MAQCYFNKNKIEPDYKDTETLQKFLNSRMKIMSREKTGVSAKNQRKLMKHIKYARYLALIPYTAYQSEKINAES
jgi:small subunit ribosomal protein S18